MTRFDVRIQHSSPRYSPFLAEVVLTSTCPSKTDRCLAGLLTAPALRVLELRPKSFMLNCEHMYIIGMMNLCELRLDSHSFKQQPLNRVGLSHIDNEGVKALVDSICSRTLTQPGTACISLHWEIPCKGKPRVHFLLQPHKQNSSRQEHVWTSIMF